MEKAYAQLRPRRQFAVQFIGIMVAAHGLFTLASILLSQILIRRGVHLSSTDFDVPLLAGLSLIYLSMQLRRQKQTAWVVTLAAYGLYFALGLLGVLSPVKAHEITTLEIVRNFVLPAVIVGLLIIFRREYAVRSDIEGFRGAVRFVIVMLVVALIYGVAGLQLMDKRDFHQEISLGTSVHYAIDQFNITTDHPLHPYTQRSRFFLDSLSFVSTAAVVYALLSLFQPLRMRLSDQAPERERLAALLAKHGGKSEDFFKLWPADKQYFFDQTGRAGLAFSAKSGVALCLGDPSGQSKYYGRLLNEFEGLCHHNGWTPALIHIQNTHRRLYEDHGFSLQKLGQEAIVDIEHFCAIIAPNKYFRHISNKFTKQGYTCELLIPPHHQAVLNRLQVISNDWLTKDARVERKFVMGYFDSSYLQRCQLMISRDAAGTIQAFVNLVPADFDKDEATFDMLRHAGGSPSNINDFLLINFLERLKQLGYQHVNLGLCPLAGLAKRDHDANKVIDGFLRFAYANGDRFYSFSGLYRFKAKYEPQWRDRFVAYKGGIPGFSRTMTALMLTMRLKRLPIKRRLFWPL